jgi:hemerythrin-like domain-containing protein
MAKIDSGDAAVWAFVETEHRELTRGLNRIHDIGCDLTHDAAGELATRVLGLLSWLHASLEPHLAWEEASLYPEIDDLAGTAWATRVARFEHRSLRTRISELQRDWTRLREVTDRDRHNQALADLFGLEALLRAHLDGEEQLLIPVLIERRAEPVLEPAAAAAGSA